MDNVHEPPARNPRVRLGPGVDEFAYWPAEDLDWMWQVEFGLPYTEENLSRNYPFEVPSRFAARASYRGSDSSARDRA